MLVMAQSNEITEYRFRGNDQALGYSELISSIRVVGVSYMVI